jgi:hypothetical protein
MDAIPVKVTPLTTIAALTANLKWYPQSVNLSHLSTQTHVDITSAWTQLRAMMVVKTVVSLMRQSTVIMEAIMWSIILWSHKKGITNKVVQAIKTWAHMQMMDVKIL